MKKMRLQLIIEETFQKGAKSRNLDNVFNQIKDQGHLDLSFMFRNRQTEKYLYFFWHKGPFK